MPKITQNAIDYALRDLIRFINSEGWLVGAYSKKDLAARCGMNYDRMLYIQKRPESMTILELVEIIDALRLEPNMLSMLFRHGKVNDKKNRPL